jgi:Rho family protein
VSNSLSIVYLLILVSALKCDLREDSGVKEKLARRSLHPVTYEEGLAVARSIRASRYLGECRTITLVLGIVPRLTPAECSAKHNRGVQEAIHEAAKVALGSRAKGGGGGGSSGSGSGARGRIEEKMAGCGCVVS